MEKPSFPLALLADSKFCDDLAVRVADKMECAGLMEIEVGCCDGNTDILTTVIASLQTNNNEQTVSLDDHYRVQDNFTDD